MGKPEDLNAHGTLLGGRMSSWIINNTALGVQIANYKRVGGRFARNYDLRLPVFIFNIMKLIPSFIISSAFFVSSGLAQDSTKTFHNNSFRPPEYPGGNAAFAAYISKNLKYPEIAQLIGINGNIRLSFVLDKSGKVVEVTPINCIGAGCEAEAVKVLEMSPVWQPGIQRGKPVKVRYTIPISFSIPKGKVKMRDLNASKYGFVFNIKGTLYNLSEAQTILGNDFESGQIEIAEPFYNVENDPKFVMPDKKEVYTITIKA